MPVQSRPVVLITGSSRGIGAETARIVSRELGARTVINYRDKAKRAENVVAEIAAAGGEAVAVRADVTDAASVTAMVEQIKATWGRLDVLVLNASGGMERGADAGYALRLNRDAQVDLVRAALPLMPSGSRVVFVTSHQAHFHGRQPGIEAYEAVAASKRAGEDALRAMIPELTALGIDLIVVSGDMIAGTITVTLLDRAHPGVVAARRDQAGEIPTLEEFATQVAAAVRADHATGHTVYVGGADYLVAR
ncbi:NAD(P)-dependent dehydrogenase, short-chain alcohol dehydrogenase family [Nakamurella panacisegetis]|uniref:NAD(P)-dependent dehydrogenase, short-chain alcohol dehydrogenase family n=1 Tax=Nakamurella panacisegetis TaxID=1090615 RepID=A0A1H0QW07_9ACTN|nr:SDR family oxidoreductase [Nakamurella panacisegetis]SDP21472.1 NAD(P)-dependent dehydrogenase, short-chain alcohol dehydrogenase family [Nakamurella panacisegetis]